MFSCNSCGAYCRHIESLEELKVFDLGNGTCKHLNTSDNSCNIYDTRLDICKIDEIFEIKYYKEFSRENFYIKNAEVCNYLQTLHNLDEDIKEIECYR